VGTEEVHVHWLTVLSWEGSDYCGDGMDRKQGMGRVTGFTAVHTQPQVACCHLFAMSYEAGYFISLILFIHSSNSMWLPSHGVVAGTRQ
jgi:hypothetical protein